MIYPTIQDLTKGKYNRYQLAIATAKCARIITDEYDEQRKAAEKVLTGSKEGASSIASLIDPALADEKAVKNAINRISDGEYEIVDCPVEEAEDEAEAEEILPED